MRDHLCEEDRIYIVEKAFEKALQTGVYQYEARLIDKDRNEKWISTNGKVFSTMTEKTEQNGRCYARYYAEKNK